MAATVTVTGDTGPGDALSAVVYSNVVSFKVDATKSILELETSPGVFKYFDVFTESTVTATKSGNTWTLVIS